MNLDEALLVADDSKSVEYPNGVFEKLDEALTTIAAEARRQVAVIAGWKAQAIETARERQATYAAMSDDLRAKERMLDEQAQEIERQTHLIDCLQYSVDKRGADLIAMTTTCLRLRETLDLIATPMRPDGSWNRDREACRLLAVEALANVELTGLRRQERK